MMFRAEVVTVEGGHWLVLTDTATSDTRRYQLTNLGLGILAPSATLALARELRKSQQPDVQLSARERSKAG